jgi:hypothetical protein
VVEFLLSSLLVQNKRAGQPVAAADVAIEALVAAGLGFESFLVLVGHVVSAATPLSSHRWAAMVSSLNSSVFGEWNG